MTATVFLVMLVGVALTVPRMIARAEYNSEAARAEVASKELKNVDDLSAAFENVADAIKPSVVSISSVKKIIPLERLEIG